jgi:hypothetical protein
VYEFMKKVMQKRALEASSQQQAQQQQPAFAVKKQQNPKKQSSKDESTTFDPYSTSEILQESCMEVAASQGHPLPAPHFHGKQKEKNGDGRKVK